MIDSLTIISLIALIISEILPFIKDHDANGILHFILNCCTILTESRNMEHIILPPPTSTQLDELDKK
jgi:hypothetical protein